MTVAPAVYRDQKWIISPFGDLFFFIGTPLLCLVTMLPLRAVFDSQTIAFYALALFATGHHLPGFMRAYGDPELFSTFKEKFLVAPIVVLIVTALAQFNTLHGLFLMVLVWEIWHLFMQHYGIMRIYDAKNKIFSKLNSRLDWLLTLCAFATVVIYSPEYFHRILDHNQRVGVPFLSAELTFLLKKVLFYVTMAVLAAYLANIVRRAVTGQKVSLPKIAVMATTVFIIYYGWIHINDLVIGYAGLCRFSRYPVLRHRLDLQQQPRQKAGAHHQAPAHLFHYAHPANPSRVRAGLLCLRQHQHDGGLSQVRAGDQNGRDFRHHLDAFTLLFRWVYLENPRPQKPSQSGDQRRGRGQPHWIADIAKRLGLVLPRDWPTIGLFRGAGGSTVAVPVLLDGRRGRGAGEDGRIVPGLGRCPQQPRASSMRGRAIGKGPPESMSGR